MSWARMRGKFVSDNSDVVGPAVVRRKEVERRDRGTGE